MKKKTPKNIRIHLDSAIEELYEYEGNEGITRHGIEELKKEAAEFRSDPEILMKIYHKVLDLTE